jgi:hypothetical protein
MPRSRLSQLSLVALLLAAAPAFAWGPDGHHTVGAIADRLIAGTNAETQVKAILGDLTLQDASVWADCAKGVDPKTLQYSPSPPYPECKIYETPEGEAAMVDFVTRNNTNCNPKPGEEICHKQYHYADIAIQHDHYDPSFTGARPDDVVHAVAAAVQVLQGNPAPAPFSLKDKREALLVLAHYAGDIHQPLHVGAVYLNAKGKQVNPDSGTFDPNTETRGGNEILVGGHKLHANWDAIPASLKVNHVDALVTQAKMVPATDGQFVDWSTAWGTDTLLAAQQAFKGITFGKKQGTTWSATLPANYSANMAKIKKTQLTKAGARLAQLLQAIWP